MSTYGTDDAKASAELTEFLANRGNVRLYALIFGCALALVVLIGSVISVCTLTRFPSASWSLLRRAPVPRIDLDSCAPTRCVRPRTRHAHEITTQHIALTLIAPDVTLSFLSFLPVPHRSCAPPRAQVAEESSPLRVSALVSHLPAARLRARAVGDRANAPVRGIF